MAFNIRYSFFEILVISFGLSNALVIFQTRINEILYLYLDVFCIVYINDILVYLNNLLEYKEYIKKILHVLQDTSF
jgi:bacteriorhodopsin